MPTRRAFLQTAAATIISSRLRAQPSPTTRPNIAEIDRLRILAAASVALTRQTATDLLSFTLDLPALAAAHHIQPSPDYPARAAILLTDYLLRLPPTATLYDIADRAALAEVVIALPFLPLDPELKSKTDHWLARYLAHLSEDRAPLLARDAKDHNGSSWLLQASAIARQLKDEKAFADCLHRYKTITIRAQIRADGFFPQELTTPDPYRNSLFNLDLLAGVCQILSTRFDPVWNHELPDGPGMRAAIARHAPYLRSRNTWPYPADSAHFSQLPTRRPALVFAARAYNQPDYATLWRTTSPDQPTDRDLLLTFPIRQPLLWLTQPGLQPTLQCAPISPASAYP